MLSLMDKSCQHRPWIQREHCRFAECFSDRKEHNWPKSIILIRLDLSLFFDIVIVFNSRLKCADLKLRSRVQSLSIQMLPIFAYVVGS